ncbi:MAG: HlyD family efflux transporter periplasmic adaptor subunit [Planctomycetaceae bacterium]
MLSSDFPTLQLAVATRGPFLVTVNTNGHVDSSSNATLVNKVEGTTTIIEIVPQGTSVKAGDVVCVLDSSSLRDKLRQQEIDVTNAEGAEFEAMQALRIQEKENASKLAAATLAVELANLDLRSFTEGEYPQQHNKLMGQVAIKEEELVRKEEAYDFARTMARKGFRTQSEVEAARIAVKQTKLDLETANEELNVLENFTKKRKEAELKANAEEFVREVERVNLQNAAELAKAEKLYETRKLLSLAEKAKRDKYVEQIDACTLRAPQAGEVVYANLSSSSRRSDGSGGIELGASVREQQQIINLPDLKKMKVDCRIHESLIRSVSNGATANIQVVSLPDQVFRGKVSLVASVPTPGRYPNYDLHEYATEITLLDPPEVLAALRPGLSAKVELMVDSRDNVLTVPVQSIVAIGDQAFCYVMRNSRPERVEVKAGLNNTSHIEILEGIKEGEQVVQNPQHAFADEIASLQAEVKTFTKTDESAEQGSSDTAKPGDGSTKGGPKGPRPGSDNKRGDRNGPPQGAASGGPPAETSPGTRPSPAAMMAAADTNGDGKLSPDEAPERLKERFAEIDTDKDGFISQEELSNRPRSRPPTETPAVSP